VLTDDGWNKVIHAAPDHVQTVRKPAIDTLTDQQVEQLSTISARMLTVLDPRPEGDGIRAPPAQRALAAVDDQPPRPLVTCAGSGSGCGQQSHPARSTRGLSLPRGQGSFSTSP